MSLLDRLRDALASGGGPARNGDTRGDTSGRDPPTDDAEALVEAAADAGYDLDYTPESLTALDQFVDDLSADGRDADARHVVAYLGEVFVRHYEGEWTDVADEGWLVDLGAVSSRDDELFALPYAVDAVLDGETTLAGVHDDTVASLRIDGPRLSDDRMGGADPLPTESRDGQRERAAELVDHWPGYDLDYSPRSLAALDDLVAAEYDASPDDVDRAERLAESPPGEIPEGATVRIGSGGEAARIAAYFGEVFCRAYRAVWVSDEGLTSVVVETGSGHIEFQPQPLVSGAFQGHVSFERFHDAIAEDHGFVTDPS